MPAPMPVAGAARIVLTAAERHRLKKAAYGHKTAHQTSDAVCGQAATANAMGFVGKAVVSS